MVKYDRPNVKSSAERAASHPSVDMRRGPASGSAPQGSATMRYARVHQPQECRSLPSLTTLSGARSALRSGAVSPNEVLVACRDRIEESEAALRAWMAWDPGAAQAEAIRMDSIRRSELPLWGIPIGIKDIRSEE